MRMTGRRLPLLPPLLLPRLPRLLVLLLLLLPQRQSGISFLQSLWTGSSTT